MNYYPLLEAPGFEGFVSLANIAPTEETSDKTVYIYGAQAEGSRWSVTPCGSLAPGVLGRFGRKSAAFLPSCSIFFFMSEEASFSESLPELPSPNKFQFSTPRWRGTLGLSGSSMDVGYSGEYPDEMLVLAKSSCLSISPLLQLGSRVETKILFINMLLKPKIASHRARLLVAETKEVLQEFQITSNTVSVCSVDHALVQKISGRLCHFAVDGVTGIPVYFSYAKETGEMSLEHSHPPVEFIVFGDVSAQRTLVRSIKNTWM